MDMRYGFLYFLLYFEKNNDIIDVLKNMMEYYV